jgi:hypothetical protein
MAYYKGESNSTGINPLNLPHEYVSPFYNIEKCNECNEQPIEDCCNKCGEGVCLSNKCCELFPHYHNSNYTICRECTTTIENKLSLILNHNDLRLLKQKINKQMTKKDIYKQNNK